MSIDRSSCYANIFHSNKFRPFQDHGIQMHLFFKQLFVVEWWIFLQLESRCVFLHWLRLKNFMSEGSWQLIPMRVSSCIEIMVGRKAITHMLRNMSLNYVTTHSISCIQTGIVAGTLYLYPSWQGSFNFLLFLLAWSVVIVLHLGLNMNLMT